MARRVILHVDMDAFYAAVEQRDDPSLRGKPVIVGGRARRGVVSTASYEARPFGVHSALPMGQALQLCPQAIVIAPRISHYAEVSEQVMDVLSTFSPEVEPLSLDEAFLDMSGSERLFGDPVEMARAVRAAVLERTQLTCSVGVASNKFLAKLASDLNKPDGYSVVPFGDEAAFVAPLPLRKLWGVGPKAAARLEGLGLRTIGDVARADLADLEAKLGPSQARHLHAIASGHDERVVVSDHDRKSVGSEVTLERDLRGRPAVEATLKDQCARVARHLRRENLVAKGLRVKIRYTRGFRLQTHQGPLPVACDDSATLVATAVELLDRFDLDKPIRLVGAAAYELEPREAARQLDLFQQQKSDERSRLEHTLDDIRSRFGDKIDYGRSKKGS